MKEIKMTTFVSLLFQKHFQFLKSIELMAIIVAIIMVITNQMKINYKEILNNKILPKHTSCLKSILILLNISKVLCILILYSKYISLR